MTQHIKITHDGEAIIPRNVCERLNWLPGMEVDVEARIDKVVVKTMPVPRERISWEEFRQRVPRHEGPAATLRDMERAVEQGRAERWARKERDSR